MDLIAYYRVSTAGQGKSGLGLDAQQMAVISYADRTGGHIVAQYKEIETGRRNDRPELARAISHAKRAKATLVISSLDRLARNVAFLSALMESGVEFVCCDVPSANRLTIHILAAVAQNEVELISQRTKAALAQAKLRGVLLGSARPGHWDGKEHIRSAARAKGVIESVKARHRQAVEAYADILPLMRELRQSQHTMREIADKLNAHGYRTRRDKPWNHVQVGRVLKNISA